MKILLPNTTLIFCLLSLICKLEASDDVVVRTKLGRVKGSLMKTILGKTIFAFRGIYYAQPPTGPLRFKPPVPVTAWNDTLDASKEGPSCPQTHSDAKHMSENCLTLSVYTKQVNKDDITSSDVESPVIVFFHHGAFYEGSSQTDFQGPRYLLDQDVVLVMVNQRLGALGFLNLGDHRAYGNYAFKDQVLDLKFIRDHIDVFGGDPNSVTLTGQSSGSRSIILHMVSPMSKGLFHRAIAMSGSMTTLIPPRKEQIREATKQAMFLNCTTESVDAMFDCLMEKPANKYAKSIPKIMDYLGRHPLLYWYPSVEPESLGDDRFLPDEPEKLIRSGKVNSVPLMIGVTADESAYLAYPKKRRDILYRDLNTRWHELAPILFLYERNTNRSKFISNELHKHYFNDQQISRNVSRQLGKLFSHAIVNYPVYKSANLLSESSRSPVYFYNFAYRRPGWKYIFRRDLPTDLVIHGDDLQYVFNINQIRFGLQVPLYTESNPEFLMVKKMTSMWAHFAKTGEPLPNNDDLFGNVTWEPYSTKTKKYLHMTEKFIVKTDHLGKNMKFWEKLFP